MVYRAFPWRARPLFADRPPPLDFPVRAARQERAPGFEPGASQCGRRPRLLRYRRKKN